MTLNGDLPAPCYQPLVSWQLHSKRRLRIGQLCVQGVLFSTVGPHRKSLSPFQVSTTSCSPPISCNSTINYWLQLQRLPAAAITTCLATIIKSLSQVELLKSQICIISLLGFKGSQLMTCLVNHGLEEFLSKSITRSQTQWAAVFVVKSSGLWLFLYQLLLLHCVPIYQPFCLLSLQLTVVRNLNWTKYWLTDGLSVECSTPSGRPRWPTIIIWLRNKSLADI